MHLQRVAERYEKRKHGTAPQTLLPPPPPPLRWCAASTRWSASGSCGSGTPSLPSRDSSCWRAVSTSSSAGSRARASFWSSSSCRTSNKSTRSSPVSAKQPLLNLSAPLTPASPLSPRSPVPGFPIWMMVVGSVIATFCIVAVFCTGASCSKCWYCFYSPVLLICSVAIIFGVVVLNLSARTIESSDGQVIEILGYNLNGQLEVLWAKGILDDRETLCQLQEVVGCSGFYNEQCRVPPTGGFSQVSEFLRPNSSARHEGREPPTPPSSLRLNFIPSSAPLPGDVSIDRPRWWLGARRRRSSSTPPDRSRRRPP